MGSLIKGSINLNKLPKDKLIKGKKGTYYDFTISVNDDTSEHGTNCGIFDSQSQEEREAKTPKNYVGNAKVIWTDGTIKVAEKTAQAVDAPTVAEANDDGLPF